MATRNEYSKDEVYDMGEIAWSKIKKDLQIKDISYVASDSVRFIMGRKREGSTVMSSFLEKVKRDLNCIVIDVEDGHLAVVKKWFISCSKKENLNK